MTYLKALTLTLKAAWTVNLTMRETFKVYFLLMLAAMAQKDGTKTRNMLIGQARGVVRKAAARGVWPLGHPVGIARD